MNSKLKVEAGRSSWTPKSHKPLNESIYHERLALVTNWFDMWTHSQKCNFLDHFLRRCDQKQLAHAQKVFVEAIPIERIDFTTVFPRHLSLRVFSFLDPKSLSRASRVSWHWKFLTEQDILWIPKCLRQAWYLPYDPPQNLYGAWKLHYVSCVNTLDYHINREEKSQWAQTVEDEEKKMSERRINSKGQTVWKAVARTIKEKSLASRKPWVPANKFPKDLTKSKKNNNIKNYYDNEEGWSFVLESFGMMNLKSNPGVNNVEEWNEMKDKLTRMNEKDFKDITSCEINQKLTFLSQNLKVNNLKEKRITELKEFQSNHPCFWDPLHVIESSSPIVPNSCLSANGGTFTKINKKKIIFISTKVPAYELLVDSLLANVSPVVYEFESTTLKSLLFKVNFIQKKYNHQACDIGFFTHSELPWEIPLTANVKLSPFNVGDEEVLMFFQSLAAYVSEGSYVDLFLPLSGCEQDRKMLNSLHQKCGISFRCPSNVIRKYDICNTQWFINGTHPLPKQIHEDPASLYFHPYKLNSWFNMAELIQEICEQLSEKMKSYFVNTKSQLASQIVGKIIYENIGVCSTDTVRKLSVALAKGILSVNLNKDDLVMDLGNYLLQHHYQESMTNKESGNKDIKLSNGESCDFEKPTKLGNKKFDKTLKRSLAIEKSDESDEVEGVFTGNSKSPSQFGTFSPMEISRRQMINDETISETSSENKQLFILKEFISTEQYYNSCLKSLVKTFRAAALASLETNRALVSWQNVKLLFDDVTNLYEVSCQLLEDLNVTIKKQISKIFFGEQFSKFFRSFQPLLSAYLLSYPSILETYDKCKRQSPHFRAYLKRFENTAASLMSSLPQLYIKPWKRVDEYIRLLTAYQNVLPLNHLDSVKIEVGLKSLLELLDVIKENKKRLDIDSRMETLQKIIIDSPIIMENGRHFIKEIQLAHLTSPSDAVVPELRVYRQKSDLIFYLFNDCMICACKVIHHIPFEGSERHKIVFVETCSLKFLRITDIPDSIYIKNAFKMWTPRREWICSADDVAEKYDWISTLEQATFTYLNSN